MLATAGEGATAGGITRRCIMVAAVASAVLVFAVNAAILPDEADARDSSAQQGRSVAPAAATAGDNGRAGVKSTLGGIANSPAQIGEARQFVPARPATGLQAVSAEPPASVDGAHLRQVFLHLAEGGAALLLGGVLLASWIAGSIRAPLLARSPLMGSNGGHPKSAAEAFYREYWHHSGEALFIYEVTPDGRFLLEALNPAHERLTGLTTAALRHREPHEFLPAETAAAVTEHYRRCLAASEPIRYEQVLSLPAGTRHWETTLMPVPDPSTGAVTRILGSCRDITALRSIIDAHIDSERRFRAIADNAPVLIWMSGLDGGCTYFNTPWLAFTGKRLEEELGAGWADGVHPDDLKRCLSLYETHFDRRAPFHMEYRLKRADGEYRRIEDAGVPRFGPGGEFLGFIGSAIDVTDRRRAEDALRESEHRFRAMAETVPAIIFTASPKSGCDYVSPRFCEYTGLSLDDAYGDGWRTALHPEDAQRLAVSRQDANQTGLFGDELRLRGADGRYRWFAARACAIRNADGQIAKWCGTLTDIDDLRQAQDKLTRLNERIKKMLVNARQTQEILQSTIDGLSALVALLDREGSIVAVNAAWRQSAQAEAVADYEVGCNYLAACEAVSVVDGIAAEFAKRLRAVLRGDSTGFRLEYPCKNEEGRRWFQARVTRFGDGEGLHLVVAHDDVTDVKAAEQALRSLPGRLLRAQDDERRRIARDLHDSTAQNLLGATFGIDRALQLTQDMASAAKHALDESRNLIDQSQREIRTTAYLLHPPMLDEAGLPASLRWYVEGFSRRSQIHVDIEIALGIRRLDPDLETALFRIAQEALTNVRRHSGSTEARLVLARSEKDVSLEVQDSGRGMPVGITSAAGDHLGAAIGVGLAGMSERLRQLGGRLCIRSGPQGTTVTAVVPLDYRSRPHIADTKNGLRPGATLIPT